MSDRWPLRVRFWKWVHGIVNRAAWKYARPPGPEFGIGLRIDHKHPLWRLNDRMAACWVDWWVNRYR